MLLDLGVHLVDQARTLLGPVTHVYAEVAARRGGSDDDVFLALQHRSGAHAHLWASVVAAAPGPRLRVLGSAAGFVVEHLDGQEDALRAGHRPDEPNFGEEPPDRWGLLVHGDEKQPVPSERGRWRAFYEGMERALRLGEPPPVDPTDALGTLEVLDAARRSAAAGGRRHAVTAAAQDDKTRGQRRRRRCTPGSRRPWSGRGPTDHKLGAIPHRGDRSP